jgi:antitoxin MazE
MQSALRKMGNSTGLIVPRALLGEIGVTTGAAMDLKVEDGKLIATPVRKKVREGWAEDAERIAAHGLTEEESAWSGFGNEGDAELTW